MLCSSFVANQRGKANTYSSITKFIYIVILNGSPWNYNPVIPSGLHAHSHKNRAAKLLTN
jgi:hypothetical protein